MNYKRIHRRAPLAPILVLATAIGMAAIGIAYTQWSSSTTVTATVSTHTFNVAWDPEESGCHEPVNGDPLDAGEVSQFTEVGSPPDELTFTISNAYPGYKAKCTVTYINLGTMPVREDGVTFTALSGLDGDDCTTTAMGAGSFETVCPELTVRWADGFCASPLSQGNFGNGDVTVTVTSPPASSTPLTFQFSIGVRFTQANAAACP